MLKNIFVDISTYLSSVEDFKINFNIKVFKNKQIYLYNKFGFLTFTIRAKGPKENNINLELACLDQNQFSEN